MPSTGVVNLNVSNPDVPAIPVNTGADTVTLGSITSTVPLGYTDANTSIPGFWQCFPADGVLGLAYPSMATLPRPGSGGASCLVDALNGSSSSASRSFGVTATLASAASPSVAVSMGSWRGQPGQSSGDSTTYWWSPVARTVQNRPAHRGVHLAGAVPSQHIVHLRAAYLSAYTAGDQDMSEQSLFTYNTGSAEVPHAVVDASTTWISIPSLMYQELDAIKGRLSGQGNGACITESQQGEGWALSSIVCPEKMVPLWPSFTLSLPAQPGAFMGNASAMAGAKIYQFTLSNRQMFCCGTNCGVQSAECVLQFQPLPSAVNTAFPLRFVLGTAFLSAFDGAFDLGLGGVGFAPSVAGASAEPTLDRRIPGQEPSPSPTPSPSPAPLPAQGGGGDEGTSPMVIGLSILGALIVLGALAFFVMRDRCASASSRKNRMEQAAIAAGSARVAAQGTALGNAQAVRRALDEDARSVESDDGAEDVEGAVEMTRVQHAPGSARSPADRAGKPPQQGAKATRTANPLLAAGK